MVLSFKSYEHLIKSKKSRCKTYQKHIKNISKIYPKIFIDHPKNSKSKNKSK